MVLCLVACGGGDGSEQTADTAIEQQDAALADAGGQDIGHDAQADAGSEPDAEACSPEQVAAAEIAVNTGVNSGEVTFGGDADVQTASIDASSGGVQNAPGESFVYIDLDTASKLEISDEDAFENDEWDVALRRTVIRLNSADSGPGSWMVTRIDAGWDAAAAPGRDAQWSQDDFVTDDCELVTEGRETIKTGFGLWYDYDPQTHSVAVPASTTWGLYNMSTHAVVKFGIESYQDGSYDIRWGAF